MPDFQEAMSKVRSLSYLSDEFAAFAVGLSYHGEGASANFFEQAMPRVLPRNSQPWDSSISVEFIRLNYVMFEIDFREDIKAW